MVKFRQKMYIAPLIPALGAKVVGAAKALGTGQGLMNASMMAGTGLQVGEMSGLLKNKGQERLQQQQIAAQQKTDQANIKAAKIQAESNQQLAQAITATGNTGSVSPSQVIANTKGFSSYTLKNQKLFAMKYNMKDVKGFGKDVGNHLWKNKGHIGGFLGFGLLAGTGKYVADRIIQKDKSVMPQEKSYSSLPKPETKSIMSKKSGMGTVLALGLGLGALQPVSSYISDKIQQKAISKKAEKQYSTTNFFRKGMRSIKRSGWNSRQNMNDINRINNSKSTWYDPRSWIWVKKIMHNPVRGTANVYNSFNMMGGETGMQSFRESLSGKHSSGSKISRDLSDFMKNHGAVSMAGIGAIGGTALFKTSDLVDKGMEKTVRAIDKNAYKYTDSKEEEIK